MYVFYVYIYIHTCRQMVRPWNYHFGNCVAWFRAPYSLFLFLISHGFRISHHFGSLSMAFKHQQFMDIRKTSKNNKQQDQISLAARVSPRPCMISPWPTRAIRIWREESANTPGMSTSRHKRTRPGDEKPLFGDDHCRSVVGYSDMICKNCKHRWLVQLKNTYDDLGGNPDRRWLEVLTPGYTSSRALSSWLGPVSMPRPGGTPVADASRLFLRHPWRSGAGAGVPSFGAGWAQGGCRWWVQSPPYGGFVKWRYPKMDGLWGKIPSIYKCMIWGYPYFRNPPYDDHHVCFLFWVFVFLSVGRCQETVCLPAENDGDARVAGTAKDAAESTAKDTAFSVQCLRWGCTMDRWTGNLKVVSKGWTLDVVVYTSDLCYHDSNPRRKIEK